METKWIIQELECLIEQDNMCNVIRNIIWTYQAEKDGVMIEQYGKTELPEPSYSDFIPVNDITKEIMISWLESLVNVEEMNRLLESKIDDRLNPKIISIITNFE